MRVEKKTSNRYSRNSFNQEATDVIEYNIYYGTFEELMQMDKTVQVARTEQTEHLFPAWDSECKYCFVANGKVLSFADRKEQEDTFVIE